MSNKIRVSNTLMPAWKVFDNLSSCAIKPKLSWQGVSKKKSYSTFQTIISRIFENLGCLQQRHEHFQCMSPFRRHGLEKHTFSRDYEVSKRHHTAQPGFLGALGHHRAVPHGHYKGDMHRNCHAASLIMYPTGAAKAAIAAPLFIMHASFVIPVSRTSKRLLGRSEKSAVAHKSRGAVPAAKARAAPQICAATKRLKGWYRMVGTVELPS